MSGIRTRARGELESEVLRVLREHHEPIGAGEVREAVRGSTPALTTVLTALDRLVDKGEAIRTAESPRRVRFHAAHTDAESASGAMREALAGISDRRAALLQFAGDLDDRDVAILVDALSARGRG